MSGGKFGNPKFDVTPEFSKSGKSDLLYLGGNMKKIHFDCNGNNAPAYSCNEPYDNSGWYYQSTDVDEVFNEASKTITELCQTLGIPLPEATLKRLEV